MDQKLYDCGFTKDDKHFRCRAGGLIMHHEKMLFVHNKEGDYYYVVGGGIHMGETSRACVEREIYEETGLRAKAVRLAVVTENFFHGNSGLEEGLDCHTIEFYYIMQVFENDIENVREYTDNGEKLVWIPVREVENYNIKPSFIPERIFKILGTDRVFHIVEERDR